MLGGGASHSKSTYNSLASRRGPRRAAPPQGPPEGGGWGVEPPLPIYNRTYNSHLWLASGSFKRPAFGPAHFTFILPEETWWGPSGGGHITVSRLQ